MFQREAYNAMSVKGQEKKKRRRKRGGVIGEEEKCNSGRIGGFKRKEVLSSPDRLAFFLRGFGIASQHTAMEL
jgi:hypothetical protein